MTSPQLKRLALALLFLTAAFPACRRRPSPDSSKKATAPVSSRAESPDGGASLESPISRALAECEPPEREGSTRELQGRLSQWAACVGRLLNAEAASVEAQTRTRLLPLQQDFTRSICELTEDSQDFRFDEDRPALIGSLVGFAYFDCSIETDSSLYRLLALARSGTTQLQRDLFDHHRSTGKAALALMKQRYARVRAYGRPTPSPYEPSFCKPPDCPPYVTHQHLAKLFDQTLRLTEQLAKEYCDHLPTVTSTLPQGRCVPMLSEYLAAAYGGS